MRRSIGTSCFPDLRVTRPFLPLTEVLEPRWYRSAASRERAVDNPPAAIQLNPPAINAVAQRVVASGERSESAANAAKSVEDEVQPSADPPDNADPPDRNPFVNVASETGSVSDTIKDKQSPALSSAAGEVLETGQFRGRDSSSQKNAAEAVLVIPIASTDSTPIFSTTVISTVVGNLNEMAHSEGLAIAANVSASTGELAASMTVARDVLTPAATTPLIIGPLVFRFASVNAALFSDGLARFIDQCAEESGASADEKPAVSHIRAWAVTLGVVAVDLIICRAVMQRRQRISNRGTREVASSSMRVELQPAQ